MDVRALGAALTGRGHSLSSLAELSATPTQKLSTSGHGETLTDSYLDYALADVQATWECYAILGNRYECLRLDAPVSRISSEASVGKAHLAQMGVLPWREVDTEVAPELLGRILSSYYGGRAEVHRRRETVEVVYADFLSMYRTVASLMELWRFVTAQGIIEHEVTAETRDLLEHIEVDSLATGQSWTDLTVLVAVRPKDDLFPVRTRYNGASYSIGLNFLTSEKPLWYTLADCIASKLLTGRAPEVVRAVRYAPAPTQKGLRPIDLMGKREYHLEPDRDDFYRRLIELRSEVLQKLREARRCGMISLAAQLEAEQLTLKILANATSYGIFVELNVQEEAKHRLVMCYGPSGEEFATQLTTIEEPGRYFHPLLATLITGAARLMLALAEVLAARDGLGWAFCDTDSMAFTRPVGMTQDEFLDRVRWVTGWFDRLNPYQGEAGKRPLFKWEAANFAPTEGGVGKEVEPLYCLAVSAKRYALFNLDRNGLPVLRKASAHGLGHLLAPYGEDDSPEDIPLPVTLLHEIGVERWQYDLWHRITSAALAGHPDQVNLSGLPGLEQPAVSRYAATTPQLLRWFDRYNARRPYAKQIKPFNFLLAFQTDRLAVLRGVYDDALSVSQAREQRAHVQEEWREIRMAILAAGGIRVGENWSRHSIPRSVRRRAGLPPDEMAATLAYPSDSDFISHVQDAYHAARLKRLDRRPSPGLPQVVAPFDTELEAAVRSCFDRNTGEAVDRDVLKTYDQALAQYHLHPEAKFLGGGYLERGVTQRRHILASSVECIGKEANRWEEQAHLGQDETAQIIYSHPAETSEASLLNLRQETRRFPVRTLASEAGLATETVQRFRTGEVAPRRGTLKRIRSALDRLESHKVASFELSSAPRASR